MRINLVTIQHQVRTDKGSLQISPGYLKTCANAVFITSNKKKTFIMFLMLITVLGAVPLAPSSSLKKDTHMLCPIEDQRGGSERSEGLGVLCEKSAGQPARQKRLRLHWMCRWCVRLRSHKQTTFPPLPFWPVRKAKIHRRGKLRYCNSAVKARSWGLWKKEKSLFLDRVFLLSSARPHYTVRGWRYNPEQRRLESEEWASRD